MGKEMTDIPTHFQECECEKPVVRHDLRGPICQMCGFPRVSDEARKFITGLLTDRKENTNA